MSGFTIAIKKRDVNQALLFQEQKKFMGKQKMSNDRKRDIALDLYLNTDKSQKEICEIVDWSEKTFGTNKEKYSWEQLKGASTVTAQNIISKLYLKLEKIADQPDINADALSKVAKSIELLSNKKVTLSQHINCAKEFCTWAFGIDAELAKKINKLQSQFITEKASNG